MNSNNKFGECCACPALYDHRIITSYVPRRDLNAQIMHELKINNSHEYRHMMQTYGEDVMNTIVSNINNKLVCKGSQFYNVVDINGYFENQLKEELNKKTEL